MNKLKGCFLHNSDHLKTPKHIYDWFVKDCGYFDPCPYMCDSFNGLMISWPKNVFCNPPYSQISDWVDKALIEHERQLDSEILLLVPARTDTKWFHKLLEHANTIFFIKGRLKFNDGKLGAPFPSIIIQLYHVNDVCYCEAGNYLLGDSL